MPETKGSKLRVAILTIVFGIIMVFIFKLVYQQVRIDAALTLIVFVAFLLAITIEWTLRKRPPGGKHHEKKPS